MRSFVASLAFAALVAFGGCTSTGGRTPGGPDATVQHWQGRMGLNVMSSPPQSFTAHFELDGDARQGSLRLSTALGISVASMQWAPGSATLRASGEVKDYPSLEALALASLGTDIPLANLFAWLAGQATPAPGWEVDLTALQSGKLTARRTAPDLQAELKLLLETD